MSDTHETDRDTSWAKRAKASAVEATKKPAVWMGVVVIGAAGGALTTWLQPHFGDLLDVLPGSGAPVSTTATVERAPNDVWLPGPIELNEDEQAELETMGTVDQHQWLIDHGGISFGAPELKLEVRGNRSDQVRITDIRPVSECSELSEGSLVQLYGARGGTPHVAQMVIDVEKPEQPPKLSTVEAIRSVQEGGTEQYFDKHTITLNKDESEYLSVALLSNESQCSVDMELTVLEDGEYTTQRVFGDDKEVIVAPIYHPIPNPSITGYYMGGDACDEYIKVHPGALHRLLPHPCGANIPALNLTTTPTPAYPGTPEWRAERGDG